jgi:predicted membrane-bound mannosyltransferase
MSRQSLEYRTAGTTNATGSSQGRAVCLLGVFFAVMVCVNVWLYHQGVDKMDVIVEAIVIYIFGPAINAVCGVALFGCALLLRRRRGKSAAISACLIATTAAPLLAMLIDGIVISAAFH